MTDTYNVVATLDGRHIRLRLLGGAAAADEAEDAPALLTFKEALNLGSIAMRQRELSGVQIIRAA